MLAIVCPGQGSQTPGMLSDWIADEQSRGLLESYGQASGTDLITHGTASDAQTIRDTAVAQPLIVASSLIAAHRLGFDAEQLSSFGQNVLVSGHSVGEIPAAALAGVVSEEDALRLIGVRASAMAKAAAAAPSGMSAVVGGVETEVYEAIEAAGLTAANINAPGQIVAAGGSEQLQQLAENAPNRARVIPLPVAGAFHTDYMEQARSALEQAAAQVTAADPQTTLISNRDGEAISSGEDVLNRLVDQVTRPVQWTACMGTMAEVGVTGILELLPGGTLVGLAKRGLKGVPSFAVTSPDDLDGAREFIAEHTATSF